MFIFYKYLTNFLYPFLILLIFLRKILNKEDKKRFKEKIFPNCFNVIKNKEAKLVWFHAASIGELKCIIPVLKELNKSKEKFEFLITTVTLSSSYIADKEFKRFANIHHRFFPIDVSFVIQKFIKLWKPKFILLVESEIWPNIIIEAKNCKIPLGLINARITEKTYKRWKLIPYFSQKIFQAFDICLSSNLETSKYLEKLNAKNIFNTGNLKLINTIEKDKIFNENKELLKENKFWFAASTHEGEEDFCLETHLKLKKKLDKIITIIAPRHINRTKKIKYICEKYKLNYQILNSNEKIKEGKEIILINSFGVLLNYFKYAKSVFVGKSMFKHFKKVGGQNPVEAASLGCKIYHGQFIYNFKEIYEILEKNNISKVIKTSDELAESLAKDLTNSKKRTEIFSELMDKLGQKTLYDNMKNLNNFIINET